jgi:hypothetical protein
MSALSAGRVAAEWAPNTVLRTYAQAVSKQVWNGALLALNASGYAQPGVSGTGQIAIGVAQYSQLTTSSQNTNIDVHAGIFNFLADSAFGLTAIGSNCYIVDDQTVSLTSTGHSLAGVVQQIDAAGNPFVKIGL